MVAEEEDRYESYTQVFLSVLEGIFLYVGPIITLWIAMYGAGLYDGVAITFVFFVLMPGYLVSLIIINKNVRKYSQNYGIRYLLSALLFASYSTSIIFLGPFTGYLLFGLIVWVHWRFS